MNVRGERIIIFGDSLSHPGSDASPTIQDVLQGSSRQSSAPGDLLASLLLEQGAAAVRINARVGRSAWNFWQREAVAELIAADRAFQPTKVIVILGTNDADSGVAADKDRAAFTEIRDTYKAMGAEVFAVGPFISAIPGPKVEQTVQVMRGVFGMRFIDGRSLSQLAALARDGVHYTTVGARTLALALADAIISKMSPTSIWNTVGLGLLGVGVVFAGGMMVSRYQRKARGFLSDSFTTASDGAMLGDVVDIVNGKRHRGSTNELVRKGFVEVPCSSKLDESGLARCWSKKKPIDIGAIELAGPEDRNYRVAYSLTTRHDGKIVSVRDVVEQRPMTLAEAEKFRRTAKRAGYNNPWIETLDGEFVPVTGAKRDPKLPDKRKGDVHATMTSDPPKDKPRRADDYVNEWAEIDEEYAGTVQSLIDDGYSKEDARASAEENIRQTYVDENILRWAPKHERKARGLEGPYKVTDAAELWETDDLRAEVARRLKNWRPALKDVRRYHELMDELAERTGKSADELKAELGPKDLAGDDGKRWATPEDLKVGQYFDRFGETFVITKITGRKNKVIYMARPYSTPSGRTEYIDQRSFEERLLRQEYLRPTKKPDGLAGRAPRTGPNASIESRADRAWFKIQNAYRDFPDEFAAEHAKAKKYIDDTDAYNYAEPEVAALEKTARSIGQRAAKMRKAAKPLAGPDDDEERDRAIAYAITDSASRAPKFGRKVMISDVYEQLVEDGRDDGMSLDEFKRELVRLHKADALTLTRADLVAALDSNKVAKSETDARGATFHFVTLAGPADDDDDEPRDGEDSETWWQRINRVAAEKKKPMREALAKHDALILQSGDRRVLLLKTPEVADVADGAFRVTEFDADGPIGHTTRRTVEELADEMFSTWRPSTITPATDDDVLAFTSGERFAKGAAQVIEVQKHNTGKLDGYERYRRASATVDGRKVREDVPNRGSIAAELTRYKILPGIREVPFDAFNQMGPLTYYSASEKARVKRLADQISASRELNPLIVVEDAEGPYILEGGHRFDALRELGAKAFPALVVVDLDSIGEP